MPSFFHFLRSFDIFGVQITQKYNKDEEKYRSIIGGITTLVIYILSAAYTFYIVLLWATKELSPKVSTQTYLSDFSIVDLDYDFLKVSYWKYNDQLIDPFEQNILSIYYYYWSFDGNETTHIPVNRSDTSKLGSPQVAPRMKLQFEIIDEIKTVSSDFYVVIGLCQQQYITDGSQCASKELTDEFFKQKMNNIQMDLKFKRLDPMKETEQEITQTLYIQFDEQICFTQNFYFRTNHYVIKDALFFGKEKEYEFIDDVQQSENVNSLNYCEIAFNRTVYATIYLNLNQMQKLTRYEYENIGDLLANIGSVVTVLFMVKYLCFTINSYFHQQSILKSLIEYYYPEFKQIQVIKDWRHKILVVKQGNKYLDINEYIKFQNKMQDIMHTKLSLSNILYELSRITFALRSIQTRDQLRKTHSCGIKLNLQEVEVTQFNFNSEQISSSRYTSIDNILNEEDCHILSIDERGLFKSRRTQKDESSDFYDLNKIQ